MKTGKLVALGFGAVAVIGLIAGWWLRTTLAYQEVSGLTETSIGGQSFAISEYVGLDNPSAPSRLRGCFQIADPAGAIAAGAPAGEIEPLATPPGGFDCWKPQQLDEDVKAGRATAIVAEVDQGVRAAFERVVVIYPDGRAYHWRRFIRDEM